MVMALFASALMICLAGCGQSSLKGEYGWFLRVDGFIYADTAAHRGEVVVNRFYDSRFLSNNERKRGFEIAEYTGLDSYPTMIAINACKYADSPKSPLLSWVDENTIIVIGDRLGTVDEFRALKSSDYISIIYFKSRKAENKPSIVYALTDKSVDIHSGYEREVFLDTPDADIPEFIEPGVMGLHGTYLLYSCNNCMYGAIAGLAVNGNLVGKERYMEVYDSISDGGTKVYSARNYVYRGSEARSRFGTGFNTVYDFWPL